MRQKAALHRVGEDATQAGVDTLDGAFGERLSGHRILLLTKFGVEISEVFGLEVGQLVAAQARHEAVNILLVPGQCGLCQLIRSNFPQPHLGISCESDGFINRFEWLVRHWRSKSAASSSSHFSLAFGVRPSGG